jgi:hypothetical protein
MHAVPPPAPPSQSWPRGRSLSSGRSKKRTRLPGPPDSPEGGRFHSRFRPASMSRASRPTSGMRPLHGAYCHMKGRISSPKRFRPTEHDAALVHEARREPRWPHREESARSASAHHAPSRARRPGRPGAADGAPRPAVVVARRVPHARRAPAPACGGTRFEGGPPQGRPSPRAAPRCGSLPIPLSRSPLGPPRP